MAERHQTSETEPRSPFSKVVVVGYGQIGQACVNQLMGVPGLEELSVVVKKDKFESLRARRPQISFVTQINKDVISGMPLVILAVPNAAVTGVLEDINKIVSTAESCSETTIVLPQNGLLSGILSRHPIANNGNVNVVRASWVEAVVEKPDGEIDYRKDKLRTALAPVIVKDEGIVQDVASLFQLAGFRTELQSNYEAMEKTKLVLNTIGMTTIVTGMTPFQTFDDPELCYIELIGLKRRLQLLDKAGYRLLGSLCGIPTGVLFQIRHIPDAGLRAISKNSKLRRKLAKILVGERGDSPPAAARKLAQGKKPVEVWEYLKPFLMLAKRLASQMIVINPATDKAVIKLVTCYHDRQIIFSEISPEQRYRFMLVKFLAEDFKLRT